MMHPFIHVPTVVPGFKEFALTNLAQNFSSNTAYTFSSMSLGRAAANRLIIVTVSGLAGSTGRTLDSVTIGGVTATLDIARHNTGNSQNGTCGIASLLVPTGTSANVVATFSGGIGSCTIAVYRAAKLSSTTVFDIAPDNNDDNQESMSINVPSQGIVVAVSAKVTGSNSTWSGVDEDYDSGDAHSHASRKGIAATTGYSVSVNAGADPSRYACASYG